MNGHISDIQPVFSPVEPGTPQVLVSNLDKILGLRSFSFHLEEVGAFLECCHLVLDVFAVFQTL